MRNVKFVFSIFDKKAKSFDGVMLFDNMNVAKRSVVASLTPQSLLVLYPQDYVLQMVGIMDMSTGEISAPKEIWTAELITLVPVQLQLHALDGSFANRSSGAGESE